METNKKLNKMETFELLEILKPLNLESKTDVFVTFLQLDFQEVWFNVCEDDFLKLREIGELSFGWTRSAEQVLMGNASADNF